VPSSRVSVDANGARREILKGRPANMRHLLGKHRKKQTCGKDTLQPLVSQNLPSDVVSKKSNAFCRHVSKL